MKVTITAAEIAERVRALGAAISKDYATSDRLVIVVVLRGAFVFAADLIRAITVPFTVEFVALQSYGDARESSGVVRFEQATRFEIEGRDVLIVEDIVDTGRTAHEAMARVASRGARTVRLCALLSKPSRTVVPVEVAYLGFTIPDQFVVGYGLDDAQRHRGLPDLHDAGA